MPVTLEFKFGVTEDRDTISDMRGEAHLISESLAIEVLKEMKVNDPGGRLLTFEFGKGEVSNIVVAPYGELK